MVTLPQLDDGLKIANESKESLEDNDHIGRLSDVCINTIMNCS